MDIVRYRQMNTYIVINFQIIGFHKWSDAPDKYAYLRNLHRHIFHYCIEIEVPSNDRHIEFIALKDQLKHWVYTNYGPSDFLDYSVDFGEMSCEMLARDLYDYLRCYTDKRSVSVLEDGENGAIIQ